MGKNDRRVGVMKTLACPMYHRRSKSKGEACVEEAWPRHLKGKSLLHASYYYLNIKCNIFNLNVSQIVSSILVLVFLF